MPKKSSLNLVLYAVTFFVFFQLLTSLIETAYTYGLLNTAIPPEIGFTAFLLTPLLLFFFPAWLDGPTGKRLGLASGSLALLCWGAVQYLDTRGQLIAAGIGTGAILIFLPVLYRRVISTQPVLSLASGLAFGVLITILLRIENFGNGELPGERNLITIAGIIVLGLLELGNWYRAAVPAEPSQPAAGMSIARVGLACAGIASILTLLNFGYSTPAVLARWSGAESYPLLLGLSAVGLGGLLVAFFGLPGGLNGPSRPVLIAWNGLFGLALAAALLPQQVVFPTIPEAFPLAGPPFSPFSFSALLLSALLHPVLYIDFALLTVSLHKGRVSPRAYAGGMAAAAGYQVILIFAQVFTTVYDYIPLVGPLFRDRFWLVITFPALLVFLAVLAAPGTFTCQVDSPTRRWPLASAVIFTVLALIISFVSPRPSLPAIASSTVRVMTFNLQQGYRADGQKGYRDQLETIRLYTPAILGLQESDTARIANGNHDLVGFLAGSLGMYAYYGPSTVTGTFGIALLSSYPIENPRTEYLYSEGEQTAVIVADITAAEVTYTVMVTHLGNGGPLIQQQQVLELVEGRQNVILMGDFNFRPTSEPYRQTAGLLQDGWLAASSRQVTPSGQDLDDRIDHIFLSPGLRAGPGVYIGEGPSDHPAVVLEIGPGE